MIARFNPLSRIAGLMALCTPLLLSVDIVSAAVSLAVTLIASPMLGVGLAQLWRRGWPLLVVTPISGVSMALYGRPEGTEYFSFFLAHVTDNSLQLAAAIMVRVLAVGLPAIVLLGGIDPTDLGDALSQKLKLSPRFVIGAVAGARLVSLFQRDLDAMRRSRRVRGIEQGPIATGVALTFGLLVLAIRRGTKLATAMEARGLGTGPRTWARVSRWHMRDTVLVSGCLLAGCASIALAIVAGTFRFLGA